MVDPHATTDIRSGGRSSLVKSLAETDEPGRLAIPEGCVGFVARLVPDLGIRTHLRASSAKRPGLGGLDEAPADARSSEGSRHKPAFDVADGLGGTTFGPIADGSFDETDKIASCVDGDKDCIPRPMAQEPLLVFLELLSGVIRPQ
jgi:hypothetical protein